MLKFLSICSGIEAASVAFAPLGWEALAFAEIEPFPCAVLAHHYPHVPNLGDLTRWREWPDALLVLVELLCGGTPCQAFSVAGLRASLADDRGNLSLIFCELYAHINQLRHAAGLPPALLLWENVPGVLSTHDNAFGCFLAGIAGEVDALQPPGGKWAHAGYVSGPSASIAYRTLDAQYFGLAQRRKRVFVVASADPAFDPAAVLFEFTGLRRDTPPRRETGQTTAPTLSARAKGGDGLGTDADADCDGACIPEITQSQALPEVSPTLLGGGNQTGGHRPPGSTVDNCESLIPHLANCLTRRMHKGPNTTLNEGPTLLVDVTHSLRAEGFDASEDGTGRGTPLVPIAFDTTQITSACNRSQPKAGDPCHPLAAGAHAPAIAFPERLSGTQCASTEDLSPVLQSHNPTAVAFPVQGAGAERSEPERSGDSRRQTDDRREPAGQRSASISDPGPGSEPFAFDLRGREGGAMPEGPHATAAMRASSGGSSRSYIAAPEAIKEAISFKPRHYRHPRKDGAASPISGPLTSNAEFAGDCSPHVAYNLHSANSCAMQKEGDGNAALLTDIARTVDTTGFTPNQGGTIALDTAWRVRRLVCEECEILQGFPIGYTLLPSKGGRLRKAADLAQTIAYLMDLGMDELTATQCAHSPDGPRYKALGNSWAVRVARWIAQRIANHLSQ